MNAHPPRLHRRIPISPAATGLTPPQLIHTIEVNPYHLVRGISGQDRTVTVNMTVDQNGKPTNAKVVQSTDLYTDGGILSAIDQYRYKPATLDGVAVPMGVTLNFIIHE